MRICLCFSLFSSAGSFKYPIWLLEYSELFDSSTMTDDVEEVLCDIPVINDDIFPVEWRDFKDSGSRDGLLISVMVIPLELNAVGFVDFNKEWSTQSNPETEELK